MSKFTPSSDDRVPHSTDEEINQFIENRTLASLRRYRGATAAEITLRIKELQREWDIERTLELNAGLLTVTASFLALRKHTGWAFLSLAVGAFLAQHAVQGWCPPLPLLRRIPFRTPGEIHDEILALRIVRGDFGPTDDPVEAFRQIHKEC